MMINKKNFRIPQVIFKLSRFEFWPLGEILLPSFENSVVIPFLEQSDA